MSSEYSFQAVAFSSKIKEKSFFSARINGVPIILTRVSGKIVGYIDACPHRGVPLSKGKIYEKTVECLYHGWKFNLETGQNEDVPVKQAAVLCSLKKVFCTEYADIIWVSLNEASSLPTLKEWKAKQCFEGTIKAEIIHVLENFLEGSHTHYVHEGWIRTSLKKRQKIKGEFIPQDSGFKIVYEPEPAKGFLTRLLPTSLQKLHAEAQYIYPYTAILEYYSSDHKCISRFEGILSPTSKGTNYFARVFLSVGIVTPLVYSFSYLLFKTIISQDKKILELQDRNLELLHSPSFFSDETDLVGQQIYAWLRDPSKKILTPTSFYVNW